ncbi:cytochrome c-type biogenesis protein [Shewanella marina]|uniref:cytochrome c-type biogenesis protein n=1 Tax=Shewanella marina TaxID=487319 RepID=UPI000471BEF1|nr:cytochrome c-type biogenesis protein [Shewanella marina]
MRLILITLLFISQLSHATGIQYTDAEVKALGFEIAKELRCPKSVNQNLFDSQAPIANELKGQIFLMLEEGKSKQTIIDFMVERYGDKINYQPEVNASTALLWFGPGLMLVIALVIAFLVLNNQIKQKRLRAKVEK